MAGFTALMMKERGYEAADAGSVAYGPGHARAGQMAEAGNDVPGASGCLTAARSLPTRCGAASWTRVVRTK